MENINHFVLWCPRLQNIRQAAVDLQQPYEEEEHDIIGKFLIEGARLKEKEILHQMWNKKNKLKQRILPQDE